jgi:hypothetical protein
MNLGVIHRVALRAENTVNHATSEKNYIPFFHNCSKSEERIRNSEIKLRIGNIMQRGSKFFIVCWEKLKNKYILCLPEPDKRHGIRENRNHTFFWNC